MNRETGAILGPTKPLCGLQQSCEREGVRRNEETGKIIAGRICYLNRKNEILITGKSLQT